MSFPLRSTVFVLSMAVVAAAATPAAAQSDRQTEDWEKEDRRYLERLQKAEEEEVPGDSRAERLKALRKKIIADAEELIRDNNFDAASNERYRVLTDDPRIDPKKALAVLDAFRAHFDSFWSSRLEPRPYGERSRVFLFYSFYKYNKLLTSEDRFGDFRPPGHYRRLLDLVLLHTDGLPPEQIPSTLVHEAAHQMVSQRLFEEGVPVPLWLSEGMAEYFALTLYDGEGTFTTGSVGDDLGSVLRVRHRKKADRAGERLKEFRRNFKSIDPEWLPKLIESFDPSVFYGEAASFRYAASWVTVHYLFHGDQGRHEQAFVRYLKKIAAGEEEPDLLFSTLEVTPADLQKAVETHARNLKVN